MTRVIVNKTNTRKEGMLHVRTVSALNQQRTDHYSSKRQRKLGPEGGRLIDRPG
jgi:hypothetical protein